MHHGSDNVWLGHLEGLDYIKRNYLDVNENILASSPLQNNSILSKCKFDLTKKEMEVLPPKLPS